MGIIDGLLIALYRISGNPIADFFTGTLLLAAFSVAVGELTMRLLMRVNRSHMQRLDKELAQKHELSVQAAQAGDGTAYRHINREANDAFGRVFFNMFTFSAASLWPAFLALAWMQTRFMSIEFPVAFSIPFLGNRVSYVFIFLMTYILARVAFSNIKRAWYSKA